MYNILVTGAGGQLGKSMAACQKEYAKYQFYFAKRADLDICNRPTLLKYCQLHQINVIVNCAAYTNVDKAETNVEDAYLINQKGAENIAVVAKELSCKLIHISTDYVFEGKGMHPYKVGDATNPVTVYGKSKLAGEMAVKEVNPINTAIIRTSWLYSAYGSNFMLTMLRLAKEKKSISVVADQKGCPTYAKDLADCILKMIPVLVNKEVVTYHFSNKQTTTWYDFARGIITNTYPYVAVLPIATKDFYTKAKRPAYSVLDCAQIINDFGITIRSWETALEECLAAVAQGEE